MWVDRDPVVTRFAVGHRRLWWTLIALCLGVSMTVFDGTAVVVALPLIKAQLGVSDDSIVWVVNAFLASYGGFLLVLCPTINLSHLGRLTEYLVYFRRVPDGAPDRTA
jgi:MFS family permease